MFAFLKNIINSKKKKVALPNNYNINIPESSLLLIGDALQKNMPVPTPKYTGRYLCKQHSKILIGVFVSKDQPILYSENENLISVSFTNKIEGNPKEKLFSFSARILKIRGLGEFDNFTFESNQNIIAENEESNKYEISIFEIEALSNLGEHSRRQYFRLDISVPVYYKPDYENYIYDNEHNIKDDIERGYIRLDTIDISAGGFKCKSRRYLEPETILFCYILMGHEALPVSLKILDTYRDPQPQTEENRDIYIMRVMFIEVNDDVRNRLTMHILNYQQKTQRMHQKIKKMKEAYKLKLR